MQSAAIIFEAGSDLVARTALFHGGEPAELVPWLRECLLELGGDLHALADALASSEHGWQLPGIRNNGSYVVPPPRDADWTYRLDVDSRELRVERDGQLQGSVGHVSPEGDLDGDRRIFQVRDSWHCLETRALGGLLQTAATGVLRSGWRSVVLSAREEWLRSEPWTAFGDCRLGDDSEVDRLGFDGWFMCVGSRMRFDRRGHLYIRAGVSRVPLGKPLQHRFWGESRSVHVIQELVDNVLAPGACRVVSLPLACVLKRGPQCDASRFALSGIEGGDYLARSLQLGWEAPATTALGTLVGLTFLLPMHRVQVNYESG